ncbi:MAG: hypothetical protein NTAFB09_08360 [Nitrosospira sp.]
MSSEIKEIQEAIHKSGVKWTATETEFIKTLDVERWAANSRYNCMNSPPRDMSGAARRLLSA